MLSSFTLISLVGVMLGVLVLVVVMAVYAGLERQVKGRILGFTPHILLSHRPAGFGETPPLNDWQDIAAKAKSLPRVQAATAFVSDNVIIDYQDWQRPVMFRGIDTSDPEQVKGIETMLDLKAHPDSTADLGIDDRAVISSILAEQLGIYVGDTIRLYSTRNFKEVMKTYKATEKPPLREQYADDWKTAREVLNAAWKTDKELPVMSVDAFNEFYSRITAIASEEIREAEVEILQTIIVTLDASEDDKAAKLCRFTAEQKKQIEDAIETINSFDVEKSDAESLKRLKKIVLPREAEVIGIYQASQMAVTPDVFVPLPLAQDLAGLEGTVQGIALRLDDAYAAEQVAAESRNILGPDWSLLTWGDQYQAFFALINQQRVMMYFALSFIVLVSAFSMMAVMFTVTIQKRREIGVMKALGAAPGQIVRVFLYQGMLLGLLGAVLGIGLGRGVIHFRGPIQGIFRTLGFDPFSASFTGFGVLPAHNNPLEQVVIGCMAFVLCSLAALVPAFFAARSDAAKSLRNL
jgi:lipoprotein-releasing system permease protein